MSKSSKVKLFNTVHVGFLPGKLVLLLNRYQKLIVYVVIGGGAVVVDVGLFWVLNELADLSIILSNTISVAVAMLYSFLLNAFFNFKTRDNLLQRFVSFAAVAFAGFVVSSLILWIFSDGLGFNATLIKVLSLPIILFLQFGLNSRFTFKETNRIKEDQLLESIN